jgi:DNA-binding transcriptional regulator YiaG
MHAVLLDVLPYEAHTEGVEESHVATKPQHRQTKQKPALPGRVGVLRSPPGGVDVRSVRERLGLTQELFARLAGISVRTVAECEGGRAPAAAKSQRMTEVRRLQEALARVIRPNFIGPWLQTPNEAFSGLKPIEVVERGEMDRIWRMIYELESGIPT